MPWIGATHWARNYQPAITDRIRAMVRQGLKQPVPATGVPLISLELNSDKIEDRDLVSVMHQPGKISVIGSVHKP